MLPRMNLDLHPKCACWIKAVSYKNNSFHKDTEAAAVCYYLPKFKSKLAFINYLYESKDSGTFWSCLRFPCILQKLALQAVSIVVCMSVSPDVRESDPGAQPIPTVQQCLTTSPATNPITFNPWSLPWTMHTTRLFVHKAQTDSFTQRHACTQGNACMSGTKCRKFVLNF